MAAEEGVIKFKCRHTNAPPPQEDLIAELKHFRQVLYMHHLIGEDENGFGFGNISCRVADTEQFIITATQTGSIPELEAKHFTLIEDYNFSENLVICKGILPASSETLTHAAIYKALPEVNAVVHVHDLNFWQDNLQKLPTTSLEAEYGTPEMALEVFRIAKRTPLQNSSAQIIIMAGHEAGILVYGQTLQSAVDKLLSALNPN